MTKNRYIVGLVFLTYFVISLVTNILGPIIPDIITSFRVSLTVAAFLSSAFFIPYGVMSIPSGFLVERYSDKPVMLAAFLAATLGSLSFALYPGYRVAVASFFVIGAGMAALQVAVNPLLRVAGGEENFAFNCVVVQLVFGVASTLSPRIFSYLVLSLQHPMPDQNAFVRVMEKLTPLNLPWASIYWIFAVSTLLMLWITLFSKFPRVHYSTDEKVGSWQMYRSLLSRPIIWMYFLAMFAYVGSEQGTADWISEFLRRYHGFDPHTTGASAISWFWALLTVGNIAGLVLLKIIDSRKVLIGAGVGAMLCLSAALFGPGKVSLFAFPAIGLFASVMWPLVNSLALNSVAEYHGSFAGILGTGIVGAAVIPPIIGQIGDHLGLRLGVAFLYLTFGYVLSVGFWAKPLITNATVSLKKSAGEAAV